MELHSTVHDDEGDISRHDGRITHRRDLVPTPTLYDPRADPRYDDNGVLKDIPGDDPLMDLCPWYAMTRYTDDNSFTPHPLDPAEVPEYERKDRRHAMTVLCPDSIDPVLAARRVYPVWQSRHYDCHFYVVDNPLNPGQYLIAIRDLNDGREFPFDMIGDSTMTHTVFSLAPWVMETLTRGLILSPSAAQAEMFQRARACTRQQAQDGLEQAIQYRQPYRLDKRHTMTVAKTILWHGYEFFYPAVALFPEITYTDNACSAFLDATDFFRYPALKKRAMLRLSAHDIIRHVDYYTHMSLCHGHDMQSILKRHGFQKRLRQFMSDDPTALDILSRVWQCIIANPDVPEFLIFDMLSS